MPDAPRLAAAGQLVWRGSGRLADGREIIYYDESPGSGRSAVPDTRDLTAEERPVPGPESGLRWDPLTGEWVIVAAQRQGRTFLPPAEHCPLDPSRPGRPTEIPAPDYDVVVFENRFPSLYGATAPVEDAPGGAGLAGGQNGSRVPAVGWAPAKPGQDGLISTARPAFGRCEVVCFTAEHEASFADLPPRRARTVLEAWADRTAALAAMPGVAQVFCFENRGAGDRRDPAPPARADLRLPVRDPADRAVAGPGAGLPRRPGAATCSPTCWRPSVAAGTRLVRGQRPLDRVRPGGGPLAVEILIFPAPPGAGPAVPGRGASGTRSGRLYPDVLAPAARPCSTGCPCRTSRPGIRRRLRRRTGTGSRCTCG